MPYPFNDCRPYAPEDDAPARLDEMIEYLFRIDTSVVAKHPQQTIDDLLHIAAGHETAEGDVMSGERV